jgi:hypothetical protein
MKSPWQLGLLALAVTGVSTYDIMFFMNRSQTTEPTQQMLSSNAAPLLFATAAGVQGDSNSLLPISKDELHLLSQNAYKPTSSEEEEKNDDWPARDPFSDRRLREPAPVKVAAILPSKKRVSAAAPLPEPHCVFSGTLIQTNSRLAIIDGNTVSIGAPLGIWRLARIETDHIILESGNETRRIELLDNESLSPERRDTL